MSVTSGFFNSVNGDRRYNANEMSALFDGIINDGIFANIGTAFSVTAESGNTVKIGIGRAWFNSAWVYNDSVLPITMEDSEILLDRYDAVVIEVDHSEAVRKGDIKIIKGSPSSTPQKPTMKHTLDVHQYPLAYVYRMAESASISQSDITNAVGTSECPYITGILQVQNIDNIVVQWQTEFTEYFSQFKELQNEDWENWYQNKKDQLSEDAAGNLQLQLDTEVVKRSDEITEEEIDEIIGIENV